MPTKQRKKKPLKEKWLFMPNKYKTWNFKIESWLISWDSRNRIIYTWSNHINKKSSPIPTTSVNSKNKYTSVSKISWQKSRKIWRLSLKLLILNFKKWKKCSWLFLAKWFKKRRKWIWTIDLLSIESGMNMSMVLFKRWKKKKDRHS